MQEHGRRQHRPIAALGAMDPHRIAENAQDMGDVVASVIAVGRVRYQLLGQRLMRGEGLCHTGKRRRFIVADGLAHGLSSKESAVFSLPLFLPRMRW